MGQARQVGAVGESGAGKTGGCCRGEWGRQDRWVLLGGVAERCAQELSLRLHPSELCNQLLKIT